MYKVIYYDDEVEKVEEFEELEEAIDYAYDRVYVVGYYKAVVYDGYDYQLEFFKRG